MSLEAITKIRAVEDGMERAKADAKAQAQKLLADAEREGRALLQKGREKRVRRGGCRRHEEGGGTGRRPARGDPRPGGEGLREAEIRCGKAHG